MASLCAEVRPIRALPGAKIKPLLPQTQVLSPLLIALPLHHVHLEGTLLPRGFFLGLGLIYLAALEVGAFYWTASAPEIVNSGREKQCSVSV